MSDVFDVAIIGGGINGCGIAADAALRGLSVLVLEKDDLASHTSSKSTKLIHGGLRYLEHYEFNLVKKALKERQTLINLAPYLIRPQAFVLPYEAHMRPAWLLKIGLFIYDYLNPHNKLPKTQSLSRAKNPDYFEPLVDDITKGFLYFDAATDDARLTIINALQAKLHGAVIKTHTEVVGLNIEQQLWNIRCTTEQGSEQTFFAKALINATGPWSQKIATLAQSKLTQSITLVKGSHIIVPRLYEGKHAYFLQNKDGRMIFTIPYRNSTMVGTTDVLFEGNPDEVSISEEEINYLLSLCNTYFKKHIQPDQIKYSWSGLRPLLTQKNESPSGLTRDYTIMAEHKPLPIVSIYGGKITTYRQLAEEAVNTLKVHFPQLAASQTKSTPLPGSRLGTLNFSDYITYADQHYSWLPKDLLIQYLSTYGTRMELFLHSCRQMSDLGIEFSKLLYQVEVDYLLQEEWATCADDVLYRRTKLAYSDEPVDIEALNEYILERLSHFRQANI